MPSKKWKRAELVKVFKALGADGPESWADSQLEEGIPQLHRFAILKALWNRVKDPAADKGWVASVKKQENDVPDEKAAAALARIAERGVTPADVMHVVRAARAEMVLASVSLLDDPAGALAEMGYDGDYEDLLWGLFTVDEDGKPGEPIDGLHESVGEVGGREDL